MSDWKKDFEKFLSDRAIKTRRSLLGVSAIAWFIVLSGGVPTTIPWIGITVTEAQRDGAGVFLCFTLVYFAASFYFESSPERRKWRGKSVQKRLMELKKKEIDYVQEEGPNQLRRLNKEKNEMFENVYGPPPEGEEDPSWNTVLEEVTGQYELELSRANPGIAWNRNELLMKRAELSKELPWWYWLRVGFELDLPLWSTGGVIALLVLRRFTWGF